MKKIYLISFAFSLAIALLFTGCKKDSSLNSTTSQLSFAMQSDNTLTALALANNNNITGSGMTMFAVTTTISPPTVSWTSAIANISKFKLEAKKDGTAIEIVTNGLVNVDLLSTLPSTINTTIANGTYTNVEVRVVLAKSTGAALPFVLKGTYTTKAGNTVPIEFDFNDDAEIKGFVSDIVIDGKSDLLAKLSLHLNQLLSNVTAQEIDQTTRTTINNVSIILISSTVNTTVYNKIKTDLMLSGTSSIAATVKK